MIKRFVELDAVALHLFHDVHALVADGALLCAANEALSNCERVSNRRTGIKDQSDTQEPARLVGDGGVIVRAATGAAAVAAVGGLKLASVTLGAGAEEMLGAAPNCGFGSVAGLAGAAEDTLVCDGAVFVEPNANRAFATVELPFVLVSGLPLPGATSGSADVLTAIKLAGRGLLAVVALDVLTAAAVDAGAAVASMKLAGRDLLVVVVRSGTAAVLVFAGAAAGAGTEDGAVTAERGLFSPRSEIM